jgi:hypothetical protein
MKWFFLGMLFMWWLDWSGLVTSHDIASFVDRESKAIAEDILYD